MLLANILYNSNLDLQNSWYRGGGKVSVMKPMITDKLNPIFWYQPPVLLQAWKLTVQGCSSQNVNMLKTLMEDMLLRLFWTKWSTMDQVKFVEDRL